MHVEMAQNAPLDVQTRGIRGQSLRASVAGLKGEIRVALDRNLRYGEGMCHTCETGGLLKRDVDFGGVPSAMVAVKKERGFAYSTDCGRSVVRIGRVRRYDR